MSSLLRPCPTAVPRSNSRHRDLVQSRSRAEPLDADTAPLVESPVAVGPATMKAMCPVDGLASSDAEAVLGRRRHDFLVKVVLPDVLVPLLRPVRSGVFDGRRAKGQLLSTERKKNPTPKRKK